MIRTQIYLTAEERDRQLEIIGKVSGIWKDRKDTIGYETVRSDWDRKE